jgi:cell division protein FtsB
MKFWKYLFVPWIIVACYALSSMVMGAAGIGPYRELRVEREKILDNLEELENINQELEGTMDALLYDSGAIKVRARELGYGEDMERFVRIVGLPAVRYRETSPGTVKNAEKPSFIPDTPLRIASVCAGLGLFLAFFIRDMLAAGKSD